MPEPALVSGEGDAGERLIRTSLPAAGRVAPEGLHGEGVRAGSAPEREILESCQAFVQSRY